MNESVERASEKILDFCIESSHMPFVIKHGRLFADVAEHTIRVKIADIIQQEVIDSVVREVMGKVLAILVPLLTTSCEK